MNNSSLATILRSNPLDRDGLGGESTSGGAYGLSNCSAQRGNDDHRMRPRHWIVGRAPHRGKGARCDPESLRGGVPSAGVLDSGKLCKIRIIAHPIMQKPDE